MRHSDLFPEFGCTGELIPLPEWSTRRVRTHLCSACGTEIRLSPNSRLATVVYPGMRSKLPTGPRMCRSGREKATA